MEQATSSTGTPCDRPTAPSHNDSTADRDQTKASFGMPTGEVLWCSKCALKHEGAVDRYTKMCEAGLLTQGSQGGRPAPFACRFYRIPTHFPLNSHGI
jgi:hypothetical protein